MSSRSFRAKECCGWAWRNEGATSPRSEGPVLSPSLYCQFSSGEPLILSSYQLFSWIRSLLSFNFYRCFIQVLDGRRNFDIRNRKKDADEDNQQFTVSFPISNFKFSHSFSLGILLIYRMQMTTSWTLFVVIACYSPNYYNWTTL